ncbi:hypothetical protein MKEN_00460500 [Mycena kentingensis (nom. inval.)]|nr:hypothetical protein MKEN_00460500 [Mycena kentingensis (nom. inval.)]
MNRGGSADAGGRSVQLHTNGDGFGWEPPCGGDEHESASSDIYLHPCHPAYSPSRTFLTDDESASPGLRFPESSLRSTMAEGWGVLQPYEDATKESRGDEECACERCFNPESASSISGMSDYWSEPSPFTELRNIEIEYVAPNASRCDLALDAYIAEPVCSDVAGEDKRDIESGSRVVASEDYVPMPAYAETVERLARLQRNEEADEAKGGMKEGPSSYSMYRGGAIAAGEDFSGRSDSSMETSRDGAHYGADAICPFAQEGPTSATSNSPKDSMLLASAPSEAPQTTGTRRVRPTISDLLLPDEPASPSLSPGPAISPSAPRTRFRQIKPKGGLTKSGILASASSSRKASSTRHRGGAKAATLGSVSGDASVATIKPGKTKGARTIQQRIEYFKRQYWVQQFGVVHTVCLACGTMRSVDRRSKYYTEGWQKHVKRCKKIAENLEAGFVVPENFERRWVELENDVVDRTFVWQLDDGSAAKKIPGAEPPLRKGEKVGGHRRHARASSESDTEEPTASVGVFARV